MLETTEELMKEGLIEKMQSLEEIQTSRLEDMEIKHKKDIFHMENELQNTKNRGISTIEKQLEIQKEKV